MATSLSSERWDTVMRLFEQALAQPEAARPDWLARHCDDPALRDEVHSLLAAYLAADDHLDSLDRLFPSAPSAAAAPTDRMGQRLAQYELLDRLGGGGMGEVYRAYDHQLGRTVALKLLAPTLSLHKTARARFVHEARAASQLDHPHIGTIHEIAEDDGQLFIVMALYDGETLRDRIARGPLPVAEALTYARQMARGLAAAHARGIVHRDVKPGNVILPTPLPPETEGLLKVVDFGVAKMDELGLTQPGASLGTPAYMSPEQARGTAVDHRADVWAFGVVLFEMLTGTRPFTGTDDQALIRAILHEPPPSLEDHLSENVAMLDHVVAMCLEKNPDHRYPTITDLLADLDVLAEGGGVETPAPEAAPTHEAASPRRAVPAAVVIGMGVVIAVLVLLVAALLLR